jgi:hypothetical protein
MQYSESEVRGEDTRPRWVVSNGATTVGPVSTDLLIRGLEAGRIPPTSWVRDEAWDSWRMPHEIREVSLWSKSQVPHDGPTAYDAYVSDYCFEFMPDPLEMVSFCLAAGMAATGASVGLAHRMREPLGLPVTSLVEGADPGDALGQVVMGYDEALTIARQGRIVLARPGESPAARAIARRLSLHTVALSGVAMFPILARGGVFAMIELGRVDHPFRTGDARLLTRIAFAAAAQLAG